MATIRPTLSCFDDAFAWVEQMLDGGASPNALRYAARVVHGICVGTGVSTGHGPIQYGHAWIEQWWEPIYVCWQRGHLDDCDGTPPRDMFYAIERDAFYRGMGVQRALTYTMQQAADLNLRTGHLGPWDRQLYALVQRHAGLAGERIVGMWEGASPIATMPVLVKDPELCEPKP